MELAEVVSFVPMGEPNVLPKDHGGFLLKNPFTLPADIPVFAVASGVIIVAGHGTRYLEHPSVPPDLQGTPYDDYHLILQISKSARVNYGHISALNFGILTELEDLPADEMGRNVEVEVKAGDILGWVRPHGAMDFSVTDFSINLNLLNPSRYPDNHPYSADIYNYLKEPLLSDMVVIAARPDPPYGGKIDYDVNGRIIGNWFLTGTTSYIQWSHQLAVVYDHLHPDRIIISDGSPMNDVPGIEGPGAPDVWWVKGNAPAPENIGVEDGMIQYTLINSAMIDDDLKVVEGVILVEMINENSIRLEVFKDSVSEDHFTSEARIYER
ncbi:MAG: hypothetical protein KFF73_11255 [Cyclobacteriaceae bacterium]|nr:hypothetical protein [Cyclobacteriaceae bacterium]